MIEFFNSPFVEMLQIIYAYDFSSFRVSIMYMVKEKITIVQKYKLDLLIPLLSNLEQIIFPFSSLTIETGNPYIRLRFSAFKTFDVSSKI